MSLVPELESPEYYENPYPTLAALRAHNPVYWRATAKEYLILSHAAIRQLVSRVRNVFAVNSQ